MRVSYANIKQLEEAGTGFMRSQDKFVFDRSLKKLEKLGHSSLGFNSSSKFDANSVLEEYWKLVDGPVEIFEAAYTNRRNRKDLLLVFNNIYDGRQIATDSSLPQLIKLFENDESDLTINRWVFTLLGSWENLLKSKKNFESVTKFIDHKLDSRIVKQNRAKLIKANKNLFLNPQGAHFFAKKIIERGITHAALCKDVGIWFNPSSYQSMVVEELFEFYLRTSKYDEVKEVIESIVGNPESFSERSKKKIISAFILHVDKKDLVEFKELAKSTGFNLIGDPAYLTDWTVWQGGSATDDSQIESARLTLNKWILSSFVDVFFRLLINDPKRKAYWLAKIPVISSVKVYGSLDDKRKLKRDERIRPYVDASRFELIHSSGSNAGIVMEIGKYQIVEFTESGALYCYSKEMNRLPTKPYNIASLKHTGMVMACSPNLGQYKKMGSIHGNIHYLNPEGRIYHSGNWIGRTDLWIKTFAQ